MSVKHVTAYYTDARDGHLATDGPLRNGPALPSEALSVDIVDRRHNPALIVGTLPASEPLAAGMTLIGEAEHADLVAEYAAWRSRMAAEDLDRRREAMVVSRFQARAVLRRMGLREQVDAIIAAPDTDPVMIDAWNDASEFRRTSPTIAAIAGQLGLDDTQIDALFEEAAGIEA